MVFKNECKRSCWSWFLTGLQIWYKRSRSLEWDLLKFLTFLISISLTEIYHVVRTCPALSSLCLKMHVSIPHRPVRKHSGWRPWIRTDNQHCRTYPGTFTAVTVRPQTSNQYRILCRCYKISLKKSIHSNISYAKPPLPLHYEKLTRYIIRQPQAYVWCFS